MHTEKELSASVRSVGPRVCLCRVRNKSVLTIGTVRMEKLSAIGVSAVCLLSLKFSASTSSKVPDTFVEMTNGCEIDEVYKLAEVPSNLDASGSLLCFFALSKDSTLPVPLLQQS